MKRLAALLVFACSSAWAAGPAPPPEVLLESADTHWRTGDYEAAARDYEAFSRRFVRHGQAKRAVFIYLNGGPSHIDTFDPKPGRETGGPFTPVATPIPGVHLGEHLPKLAASMLSLAVIRGMTSKEGNHSRARTPRSRFSFSG